RPVCGLGRPSAQRPTLARRRDFTTAVENPGYAVLLNETGHRTASHRLKRRPPRCQGEGILASDDGELACRRQDRPLINAGYSVSKLVRDVRRIELAGEHLREACGLTLAQESGHFRLAADGAINASFRELLLDEPPPTPFERLLEL